MGYRSDVTIYMYALKEKDAPAIKLWIKENFPFDEWVEYVRWVDKGLVFEANHIKWYDDYDDVKSVESALDDFEELFMNNKHDVPEGAYEYVRIGEDLDDLEVRYRGHVDYMLTVERKTLVGV
jgi:hypothetical protein